MIWHLSHRFDRRALPLANAHYSRQTATSPQFVRPGSCLVLLTPRADALWVTSVQKHVDHAWPDNWECVLFRREDTCPFLASGMIVEAILATRWKYGDPPRNGMITMCDTRRVRHKRDVGRCFRRAGFVVVGAIGPKIVLQLEASLLRTIEPCPPIDAQERLAFPRL